MTALRSVRRSAPPAGAAAGPTPTAATGPTPAALKGRALRWLAQRDHSRAELARKLLSHARALARLAEAAQAAANTADTADTADSAGSLFPDRVLRERIEAVLDGLAAAGLLNEARMAQSLAAAKAPRFGERRLRQVMQQRGVAAELIEQAATASRATELDRARALWQRRFGDTPPADASERARQMRFLAGRGFSGDVIRRVVRGLGRTPDTAPDTDEP